MITVWIVLGMLGIVVVMEIYDYRARKKTRRVSKNRKLRDEKGRFVRLRDSQPHLKDDSEEKAKRLEREISELEDSEKYFSNALNDES